MIELTTRPREIGAGSNSMVVPALPTLCFLSLPLPPEYKVAILLLKPRSNTGSKSMVLSQRVCN